MKKILSIILLLGMFQAAFSQGQVVLGRGATTITPDTNRAAVNLMYCVWADTNWYEETCIIKVDGFTIGGIDSLVMDYGAKNSAVYLWLRSGTDFSVRVQAEEVVYPEASLGTTAKKGGILPVNSTGAARTVNPPSSPRAGDTFTVLDSRGQAATNAITVDFTGAGVNYNGTSANAVLNSTRASKRFKYINSTVGWVEY